MNTSSFSQGLKMTGINNIFKKNFKLGHGITPYLIILHEIPHFTGKCSVNAD
jgi:hypothetical protein